MATPTTTKSEKKHKKRVRDEETEDGARKHKRSKSESILPGDMIQTEQRPEKSPKKSKKRAPESDDPSGHQKEQQTRPKKSKSKFITPEKVVDSDSESQSGETAVKPAPRELPQAKEPKKHKKDKKKRDRGQDRASPEQDEARPATKKSRESKKNGKKGSEKPRLESPSAEPDAAMALGPAVAKPAPAERKIPFVTQTISLYVPFFPLGFSKLPSELASDTLDPMVGTFSPSLRGILLAYRKASLSETPVRTNPGAGKAHDKPVKMHTIDECPAGFAWLTAEMDLFCPSRGASMEGKLALQSEGHIGLVCWDKFNASIEASRLPPGWKWVDTSQETAQDNGEWAMDVDGEQGAEDALDKDTLDKDGLEQLHSVGYWVDASGMRVAGKLSFRIKDFQLFAGDHQYLSIEGTMLDAETERALTSKERQTERARRAKQNPTGLLRPMMKQVPDFSMTTIGDDEQEDDVGIPRVADTANHVIFTE